MFFEASQTQRSYPCTLSTYDDSNNGYASSREISGIHELMRNGHAYRISLFLMAPLKSIGCRLHISIDAVLLTLLPLSHACFFFFRNYSALRYIREKNTATLAVCASTSYYFCMISSTFTLKIFFPQTWIDLYFSRRDVRNSTNKDEPVRKHQVLVVYVW